MVSEALKTYAGLASGVTELTVSRARQLARSLVDQGLATAAQVQQVADDLVSTSRNNRTALVALVRLEAEQSVGRLGLARSDEVRALTERVRTLEAAVRDLTDDVARLRGERARRTTKTTAAKAKPAKAPAKRTTTRKTTS